MRLLVIFMMIVSFCSGQNTKIDIKALLIPTKDQLAIQQKIVYTNNSTDSLENIVLHNWPNSFKNRKSALSKRLVESHNKTLYFADSIDKGSSQIHLLSINFEKAEYRNFQESIDILEVLLNNKLAPQDSLILTVNYKIKIPHNKFTGYGKSKQGHYNLRYWYLVPAVYENHEWKSYSNIDIDHMYMKAMDYNIKIHTPITYHVNSGLDSKKTYTKNLAAYQLSGKNRVDVQLNITKEQSYTTYRTDHVNVTSNIDEKALPFPLKTSVVNREIAFIEKYLGRFPHKQLLVDYESYRKNKVYALESIPDFLNPFSDIFKWDIQFFKALSKKFIEQTVLVNKNEDYWLTEGIHIYLMMEYCKEFYPEAKIFGNLSKIWGLRQFNLTQMDFNDKYPFIYQFTARKNLDQSLTTSIDSLSNFNRKLTNSYKSGLGLRYLEQYLGDDILKTSLKEFTSQNIFKTNSTHTFQEILVSNTDKDLCWFFGDYINSKKKIDYTLKKIKSDKDSIYVTIKNKRNITAPVALYGIKDKKIKWKQWIPAIDSTKTVAITKGDYDKVSLNYEYLYPEFNLRNNWKNVEPKLFVRPLQLKLIKDISDPYYNQIFYKPRVGYNYYDGLILGIELNNQPILQNNFEYQIVPTYSFKSNNVSGGFSFAYNHYPENSTIYKLSFGVSGSSFHYDKDYRYSTFNPSATIYFNRKTLRTSGNNFIRVKYHMINKEIAPDVVKSNEDKYNLLKLSYDYSKPELINDFRIKTSYEIASHFSKFTSDIRFRKLTDSYRRLDFRWFTGVFINNKTDSNSDYFSFGLSKPQDYLFEYRMYGRDEDAGFLYQQFINEQGGFKTFFAENHQRFSNDWMTTFNTSFNIWEWLEIYSDLGLLKSSYTPLFIGYETGIRFNFIHEIFELYFPIYSNNGWEMQQEDYFGKIRFVFALNPSKIFNSARRGFL